MLKKISLLFHTVKYLRIKQVIFRIIYRYKSIKVRSLESYKCVINKWSWRGPAANSQSIYGNGKFIFLNREVYFSEVNFWNDDNKSKLWLYNLHYFDDLNAVDFNKRLEIHLKLVHCWIKDNPPCYGNGWEPYPLSIRIVNWIKWSSKIENIDAIILNSIHQQSAALYQQIEYHILGNHIFANGKALIFSGCFFKGELCNKFLDKGLILIDRELPEQFLDDGGHFELTPMYHSIVLWDLLELIDLAKTSQNSKLLERLTRWESVARKALAWLKTMIHPDGGVSFFNDSAIGIAATPEQIFDYASRLGLESEIQKTSLIVNRSSGYSRMVVGDFVCLVDHANIGPDYLPGHAHADSLSFELSVGKQRLFVNSGTSLYGVSKERLRQRSTSAHNTIVVNDQNSSEVWSGFRVARRAYSKLLDSGISNSGCYVKACHDGYMRLAGKVLHTRRIDVSEKQVVVCDNLKGLWHSAQAHYHLHPDVKVTVESENLLLSCPDGEDFTLSCSDQLEVIESTWHPMFGEGISNKKLVYSLRGSNHRLVLRRKN